MSGFLSKLFGGKKKPAAVTGAAGVIEETLQNLFDKAQFDLSFEIHEEDGRNAGEKNYVIELHGADEELLVEKEGQLLDSIQLLLKRVLQHQLADERVNVSFDCNGFREESNKALVELAEKLKGIALEKGKSVYFRALPPKDRKVIHQHLAGDTRVKSRSIGDGLYKKIKIFPIKEGPGEPEEANL